jgi:Flp pilus assembly protein TadG
MDRHQDREGDVMTRTVAHDVRGQALVEFSLAIIVFLVLLMAVFDFGRAIMQYNGVAEAAREIARVTAVHEGTDFTTTAGRSPQTNAVIATQKRMIPNLQDPTITCVDIDGTVITDGCVEGKWINVTINAPYEPITPIMGLVGVWDLFSSSTSVQLQ